MTSRGITLEEHSYARGTMRSGRVRPPPLPPAAETSNADSSRLTTLDSTRDSCPSFPSYMLPSSYKSPTGDVGAEPGRNCGTSHNPSPAPALALALALAHGQI